MSPSVEIKWHGHAQHFTGARNCRFHLGTEIRGSKGAFVISTVGEYRPHATGRDEGGMVRLGWDRFYETYVFNLGEGSHDECGCPNIDDFSEIDSLAADTASEATRNHYELLAKWTEKAK